MIKIRKGEERGQFDHGWLQTKHTFSFAGYHDPAHVHFRALRVINEDIVQPGQGFGTHPHDNMEIVTWVLSGALQHRDSMGHGSVIRPGEVQVMSAGSGLTHSEFNASVSEPVHLLQIWLLPATRGGEPRYQQERVADASLDGRLCPIVGADGSEVAPITIRQDAVILAGRMRRGQSVVHELASGRHAWLQVARGEVRLGALTLAAGDGAAISAEARVAIEATQAAEVLLFDLA